MATSRFAFFLSKNQDNLVPKTNATVYIKDSGGSWVASTDDADLGDIEVHNNFDGVWYADLPIGYYTVYVDGTSNIQDGLTDIFHDGGEVVPHINDEQTAHAASKVSYDNGDSDLSASDVNAAIDELDENKANLDGAATGNTTYDTTQIDNLLSGKSDTNTDNADGITYDDDNDETAQTNVNDVLDELYGNQGDLSFSGGGNVDLSGESDITAALNLLRDYVANNYSIVESGVAGVVKTVLATQATEVTTDGTSGDTQEIINDVIHVSEEDVRVKAYYKAKVGSGGCVVNLYIGGTTASDKVASRSIQITSYGDFEIAHSIEKDPGNYQIYLQIEETSGANQTVYCKLASLYKESVMS